MKTKMMILPCLICFGLASLTTALPTTGLQVLFPSAETRQSTYEIKTNISCGTLAPIESDSYWTLDGKLLVQVVDNFTRVRYTLHDLKTSIYSKIHGYLSYKKVDAARFLNKPWEVDYQEDGNIKTLYVTPEEPLWATNMKRALSINFQIKRDVGTYYNYEPCLYQAYTDCSVVYVANGATIRKYNSLHILSEHSGYSSWMSVPMDFSKAAIFGASGRHYEEYSGPLDNIGTADRVYELDEHGLVSLELKSVFQHKTRSHVLAVTTELSLKFEHDAPLDQIEKIDLVKTSKRYVGHDYSDPTNGIRNYTQDELRNKTFEILINSSTGIDVDNVVRDASKIHNLNLVNLLKTMAQLDYPALRKLFDDIVLGTSYDIETARNIFLEVLPHVRTNACARFIKYLIVEQTKKIEEATLLSLIRKLPFNVANHSQSLLEELEVFTSLSLDFTQEVRHAGILSFATLVYKTVEVGKVKQDYFDDIIVKYFRMYNDCPQYIDKLVWLQGLSNIQYNIEPYMKTIYSNNENNRHVRLWAILATTQSNANSALSATWHIIMNEKEHIQIRIAAVHGFLSSQVRPSELLSLHHYITQCKDEQLKRFWYTTVNSLENSRPFNCYRVASNYIPFLKNKISTPDSKYWATGNFIAGTYDDETATGAMLQMMSIGDPKSGLPTVLQLRVRTVSELMATSDIGIFIKAEGVATSMFQKIHTIDSEDLNVEKLVEILKKMKVQTLSPEKVHIEIVVKVHDRTVYATHFNQSRFDRWRGEDLTNSIEDFLRFGSHINQQVVYYPFQLDANIPTELGTPVRLQTAIVSFSSIRGNLTAPSSKDWTWRNDLHLRYLGTAVTSLCTDGPLMKSEHTVRVQQSVVSHLPMKFEVSFSPLNKSFTLKWPNPTAQNAGLAMHAQAQVAMESLKGKDTYAVNAKNGRSSKDASSIFFDCDHPMTVTEVAEKLLASPTVNYDFLTKLRPSVLILNGLLLLSAPPSGSCGLLIGGKKPAQPHSVLELTVRCDELRLTHDDVLAIKLGNHLMYREHKPNGLVYLNVTGFVQMRSADGNATIEVVVAGDQPDRVNANNRKWKFCLSQNEMSHGPVDRDISVNPAAYDGHLTVGFSTGKDEQICFADGSGGSTLDVQYRGTPSDDEKHLDVYVKGSKLPDLDLLIEDSFGSQAGFSHLLHDLEKVPLHVTAVVKEKDDYGTVQLNRGAQMRFKYENFAWLMESWSNMQIMKKFGIYRECRLTDSTILTLSGALEHLPPVDGLENLALADCTDKPRFAVLRTNGGGVKFYTGGHSVLLTRTDGKVQVSINDVETECNPKCTYPLDQIQPDFKITRLGDDVKIHSRLSGVQVYYRQNGTVILAPHSYMSTACGSCQAQHYYKLS